MSIRYGSPLSSSFQVNTSDTLYNKLSLDLGKSRKRICNNLRSEALKLQRDVQLATRLSARIRPILELSNGQGPIGINNSDELSLTSNEKCLLLGLLQRTQVSAAARHSPGSGQELEDIVGLILYPCNSLNQFFETEPPLPSSRDAVLSHMPLQLSATRSLPFLQAFTPLILTSTYSFFSRQPSTDMLVQTHVISVCSTDRLFAARLVIVIDVEVPAVISLVMLSICEAGRLELSPFVAKITHAKIKNGVNATIQRESNTTCVNHNLNIVGCAMSEWYVLAYRRARVWAALEKNLGSNAATSACVAQVEHHRRKANRDSALSTCDHGHGDGGGNNDSERSRKDPGNFVHSETRDTRKREDKVTTTQIRPHMGRRWMDFSIPLPHAGGHRGNTGSEDAKLRLEWSIDFDWTGVAQNKISLLIGMPGKWHMLDRSGHITRLASIFDKLILDDHDLMLAVELVAAILVRIGKQSVAHG